MPTPAAFKAAEKRFKHCKDDGSGTLDSRCTEDLIDFHSPEANTPENRRLLEQVAVDESAPAWLRDARIYALRGVDGFRFICSPFTPTAQLGWARQALQSWVEPPSVTNLSESSDTQQVGHTGLWAAHQQSGSGSPLSRVSWATLGYHYQWTPRSYDPGKHSHFPPELARLAADLALASGGRLRAEAAIVNYYKSNATMGGHRDDAEPFQERQRLGFISALSGVSR